MTTRRRAVLLALASTALASTALAQQPTPAGSPAPAPAQPARTAAGVALPIPSLARYLATGPSQGTVLSVDSAGNTVTMSGPAEMQVRLFQALGNMPANYVLEGTVTVAPCGDGRFAGMVLAIGSQSNPGYIVAAASDGTARLVRLGADRMDQVGANIATRATAPTEAMRHSFRITVMGTLVGVSVDGGRMQAEFLPHAPNGMIGLIAPGGQCTARFDQLRVTTPS